MIARYFTISSNYTFCFIVLIERPLKAEITYCLFKANLYANLWTLSTIHRLSLIWMIITKIMKCKNSGATVKYQRHGQTNLAWTDPRWRFTFPTPSWQVKQVHPTSFSYSDLICQLWHTSTPPTSVTGCPETLDRKHCYHPTVLPTCTCLCWHSSQMFACYNSASKDVGI